MALFASGDIDKYKFSNEHWSRSCERNYMEFHKEAIYEPTIDLLPTLVAWIYWPVFSVPPLVSIVFVLTVFLAQRLQVSGGSRKAKILFALQILFTCGIVHPQIGFSFVP